MWLSCDLAGGAPRNWRLGVGGSFIILCPNKSCFVTVLEIMLPLFANRLQTVWKELCAAGLSTGPAGLCPQRLSQCIGRGFSLVLPAQTWALMLREAVCREGNLIGLGRLTGSLLAPQRRHPSRLSLTMASPLTVCSRNLNPELFVLLDLAISFLCFP